MKKRMLLTWIFAVAFLVCLILPAKNTQAAGFTQMMRLYNPDTHEHLHTADAYEKYVLTTQQNWEDEGNSWLAPTVSKTPVYRLFHPDSKEHFYTKDAYERGVLIASGWNDENIGWYSDDARGVPVYRVFNADAGIGAHHYTTDYNEYITLTTQMGWTDEGIAWYGMDPGAPASDPGKDPDPDPDPSPVVPVPEETKAKPRLDKVTYQIVEEADGYNIFFEITLQNPNTDYVVIHPNMYLYLKDSAGQTVCERIQVQAPYINVSSTLRFPGIVWIPKNDPDFPVTGVPVSASFEIMDHGEDQYEPMDAAVFGAQSDFYAGITEETDDGAYTWINGTVQNNSQADAGTVNVFLILMDANKNIAYIYQSQKYGLAAGETCSFSFGVDDTLAYHSYRMVVVPDRN